jgi:hypothetical protein
MPYTNGFGNNLRRSAIFLPNNAQMGSHTSPNSLCLQNPEKGSTDRAPAQQRIEWKTHAQKDGLKKRGKIVAARRSPLTSHPHVSMAKPSLPDPGHARALRRNLLEYYRLLGPSHLSSGKEEPSEEHRVFSSRNTEFFRERPVTKKSHGGQINQAVAGAINVEFAVKLPFPDRPEPLKFLWYTACRFKNGLDGASHNRGP